MMRALQMYGPAGSDIEIRQVPIPTVGKRDVLMKVKSAGICGSDLRYIRDIDRPGMTYPRTFGHEFAGVVAAVGEEVTRWKVGDRIVSDNTGGACGVCHACANADFLNCIDRRGLGSYYDGGFAEYVLIPGDILALNPNCLYRIPDNVSFQEASILDPVCNAYKTVIQQSSLIPGDDVVIYGPGPIGLFCVQWAKVLGMRNIIIVGTKNDIGLRLDMAKKFGATHVLISGQDNIPEEVEKISGRGGIGTVIDCAGPAVITEEALKFVRKSGEILRVGVHHGTAHEAGEFGGLVLREIRIQGHYGYDYTSWHNAIRLIEAGKFDVKSEITCELPLEQWREGMDLMLHQKAIKVVLNPEL